MHGEHPVTSHRRIFTSEFNLGFGLSRSETCTICGQSDNAKHREKAHFYRVTARRPNATQCRRKLSVPRSVKRVNCEKTRKNLCHILLSGVLVLQLGNVMKTLRAFFRILQIVRLCSSSTGIFSFSVTLRMYSTPYRCMWIGGQQQQPHPHAMHLLR